MLWLIWFVLVFLLLLVPLGWGWGYRGWGAPRPSYWRGRRRYVETEPEVSGWGILADIIWLFFFILLIWFVIALIF